MIIIIKASLEGLLVATGFRARLPDMFRKTPVEPQSPSTRGQREVMGGRGPVPGRGI